MLEWVRHSNPSAAPNLICTYLGPKYDVPHGSFIASAAKKRARTGKATPCILVNAPGTSAGSNSEALPPIPELSGLFINKSHETSLIHMLEIKLSALYDPRLLCDYGGPLYNHVSAKLVQRNIVDAATNTLVAPWEEYDKLRTGTVVIMKVSLHTYTISFDGRTKKVRVMLGSTT